MYQKHEEWRKFLGDPLNKVIYIVIKVDKQLIYR